MKHRTGLTLEDMHEMAASLAMLESGVRAIRLGPLPEGELSGMLEADDDSFQALPGKLRAACKDLKALEIWGLDPFPVGEDDSWAAHRLENGAARWTCLEE